MPSMSEKEITATLLKIRKEYEDGAAKYNSNAYNIEAFNERYRAALVNKQNLTAFLLAETRVLEDIKVTLMEIENEKRKKKEEEELASQNSFMNKVDAMIERFQSAVSKYPSKPLHEKAEDEISHLYGALEELYNCFSVVKSFCTNKSGDYVVETVFKDFDTRFQPFVIQAGSAKCPHIYADYVFSLKTGENTSRAEQYILKEAGFFLHSFIDKFTSIRTIALKVSADNEIILPNFLHVEAPRVYKFFTGKSKEDIYDATIAYAQAIITDFRLQSFKKNDK